MERFEKNPLQKVETQPKKWCFKLRGVDVFEPQHLYLSLFICWCIKILGNVRKHLFFVTVHSWVHW